MNNLLVAKVAGHTCIHVWILGKKINKMDIINWIIEKDN